MSEKILFLDDETNILNSLRRLFVDEPYEVLTASDALAALDHVREDDIAVVVSDQLMPEMTGTEFLAKVSEIRPEAVRIIMTGHADIDAAVAAINLGHVYRFIRKPWDDAELKLTVRNAFRRHSLAEENRKLLALTQEQNAKLSALNQDLEEQVEQRTKQIRALMKSLEKSFHQSFRLLLEMLELFSPDLPGHSRRTAALSVEIARRYGFNNKEIQVIETAAILHDVGLFGLPPYLLTKKREQMSAPEIALIQQHPELGHAALDAIEELKEVAVLVRAHHENMDGTGYPDALKNFQIPVGARIIHLANDFDNLTKKDGLPREEALKQLKSAAGRVYDPDILIAFLELGERVRPNEESDLRLGLDDLKPGMVLASPIRSHHGRLLLAEGTELTPLLISKLFKYHQVDRIIERIRIRA